MHLEVDGILIIHVEVNGIHRLLCVLKDQFSMFFKWCLSEFFIRQYYKFNLSFFNVYRSVIYIYVILNDEVKTPSILIWVVMIFMIKGPYIYLYIEKTTLYIH